jgi:nitrogen PTS system EIIA component
MDLGDLIKPDAVVANLRSRNNKALLSEIAAQAGACLKLNPAIIYEALWQREMLSSTGVGRGIAIPHARVPGLGQMFGLFGKLEQPIEFGAIDDKPVDLVFLLLAPEHAGADHLKALARVSRLMRDPATLERLRGSKSRSAMYAVLTEPSTSNAA